MFNFIRNRPSVFWNGHPVLRSHQRCMRVLAASSPAFSLVFILAMLIYVKNNINANLWWNSRTENKYNIGTPVKSHFLCSPFFSFAWLFLLLINIPYKTSPPWEKEEKYGADAVELGEFVIALYLASPKKMAFKKNYLGKSQKTCLVPDFYFSKALNFKGHTPLHVEKKK